MSTGMSGGISEGVRDAVCDHCPVIAPFFRPKGSPQGRAQRREPRSAALGVLKGNAVKDSRKVFLKVLPPLPHIRRCFRGGLDCGGEGRGEGAGLGDVAPSPQPSPPQNAQGESHIDRGGEGAGNVLPPCERDP